jgi:hypothetical protein
MSGSLPSNLCARDDDAKVISINEGNYQNTDLLGCFSFHRELRPDPQTVFRHALQGRESRNEHVSRNMEDVRQTDPLLLSQAKFTLSDPILIASRRLRTREIIRVTNCVDKRHQNTNLGFFLRPGLPG